MYNVILIVLSAFWFIWINLLLLINQAVFALIFWLIIILLLFVSFKKIPKDKYKNLFAIYSIFLLFFAVYIAQYSYMAHIKYEEKFLSNIEVKTPNLEIKTIAITEYEDCLNESNNCDFNALWQSDIEIINHLLKGNINAYSLSKIESELVELIEKKELLEKSGISPTWSISFDKELLAQNFFIQLKNKRNSSDKRIIDNFFINKNQFSNYLNGYYYFVYENIITWDAEAVKNSTYRRYESNPLEIFIKRENLYNVMITPPSSMYSIVLMIWNIEKNINEVNWNY